MTTGDAASVTIDFDEFVDTLRSRQLFEAGSRVVISRAPGRLDVMGGIADYSGSLVLQRPIAEATFAAVQLIDRRVLEVVSVGRTACVIPLEALTPDDMPIAYEAARRMFSGEGGTTTAPHWVSYVAGVFLVLARERGLRLTSGVRVVVASRVPEGKGVSSSAAIETACMQAAATAFDLALEPRDLALLCQKSENLVSGAPCGVMDQMTCVFGQPDQLLALLCQPAELQPPVPLPDGIELWGLDSGERHAVGGSDYTSVRTGAFIGLRLAAERLGAPVDHLANLSPSVFEKEVAACLPEEIAGDDFLAKYGGTVDTVTRVEPGRRYRVRGPAAHPVYERQRAEDFRRLLSATDSEQHLAQLGQLMFESHDGYSACGLGSPGTDHLVELVRTEGAKAGLFGARITGGGSGGTVAVIGRRGASAAIARVADAYERITGYRPYVFTGSSPGVATFGTQSITL